MIKMASYRDLYKAAIAEKEKIAKTPKKIPKKETMKEKSKLE